MDEATHRNTAAQRATNKRRMQQFRDFSGWNPFKWIWCFYCEIKSIKRRRRLRG